MLDFVGSVKNFTLNSIIITNFHKLFRKFFILMFFLVESAVLDISLKLTGGLTGSAVRSFPHAGQSHSPLSALLNDGRIQRLQSFLNIPFTPYFQISVSSGRYMPGR